MIAKLTGRNLLANKARVMVITFAVMIGVSFVVSTFVFSDSLSRTFTTMASDVTAGVDLEVRAREDFGAEQTLTTETADIVANVDGVRAVGPARFSGDIAVLDADGSLPDGETVALSWVEDEALSAFTLVEGRAPGAGEFATSTTTAEAMGLQVGTTYDLATPHGVRPAELSGLVSFKGGEGIESGFQLTLLSFTDTQQLFVGTPSSIDELTVSISDTADATAVRTAIEAAVGNELDVVDKRTIEQEQAADFNRQIAILRNLLLGFAVVALFVSTFIIYNTFGIILSQRVREIGLLRAVGAEGSQITRGVLGEAAAIGVIASALGLLGGLGLNAGLIAMLNRFGAEFPDMQAVVSARTIAVAILVGVGVTFVCAIVPARRASLVPPIAALRGMGDAGENLRRRLLVGLPVVSVGAMLVLFGLFTASGTRSVLASVGAGAAISFIGVSLLSPVLAEPIVRLLGAPLSKLAGACGLLASGNAARNRRRTATTASALMIGLSLITTALVVGQSFKSHIRSTLEGSLSADFIVANDFQPIPDTIGARIAGVEPVSSTVEVSAIDALVDEQVRFVEVASLDVVADMFDLDVVAGSLDAAASVSETTVALSGDRASDLGVQVNDRIDMQFANGQQTRPRVVAIFDDATLFESGMLLHAPTVREVADINAVSWIAGRYADGVDAGAAAESVKAALVDFPAIEVQTSAEYRASIEDEIDQLLSIINAMLALSIVIALLGIGLTLALSVLERTREIGLLRAVGMSGRQVRRMIRYEAALIATFGSLLGAAMGVLFGWAIVAAMPDGWVGSVAIPFGRITTLIVVSAIAGLVAAMLPARRAARLDVLAALAS